VSALWQYISGHGRETGGSNAKPVLGLSASDKLSPPGCRSQPSRLDGFCWAFPWERVQCPGSKTACSFSPVFSYPPLEDGRVVAGELLGRVGCGWVMPRSLPRLPALHPSWPWDRMEDPVSPTPAGDKGFDNPMFDMVSPGDTGGGSGPWAGGGRAPAGTLSRAMHPAGLLLSPGQKGVWGRSRPPAGHQLLGCHGDSALRGFCFPSSIGCFSLPHRCRNHQALTLGRRCHRRRLPKTTRSSTSTLCTMQARRRSDNTASCRGQPPPPWGLHHLSSPHSPSHHSWWDLSHKQADPT